MPETPSAGDTNATWDFNATPNLEAPQVGAEVFCIPSRTVFPSTNESYRIMAMPPTFRPRASPTPTLSGRAIWLLWCGTKKLAHNSLQEVKASVEMLVKMDHHCWNITYTSIYDVPMKAARMDERELSDLLPPNHQMKKGRQ